MRYFIFPILLALPLLLTAQSKKEQIATLELRVDSLSEVLVNERITNTQTLSDKSDEIFQLSQEKGGIEKEKLELEKEKLELENEMETRLLELGDSLNNYSDRVNTLTENIADMEAWLLELGASFFTSCGDQIRHEGYSYSTVRIDDQCWFSENCRYLPQVSPSSEGNSTDPYYYVYDYEGTDVTAAKVKSHYSTYGALYNWPAVMTDAICPSGWHIPSDGEWQTLEISLGMSASDASTIGFRGSPVGDYMKSTSGFYDGNGSNSSGFSGLPGGYLSSYGFNGNEHHANWWSASESYTASNYAWAHIVVNFDDGVSRIDSDRNNGYSARCVRECGQSEPAGDEASDLNPWEGVYLGDQSGYFLTKASGEPMVINGKKIPVPGSAYTITIKGLGIEVVQIAKDPSKGPVLYMGSCLVDAQSETLAQLSCTCKEQSSSKYPAEPEISLAINLIDQTMVVNGNFGPEFSGIKQ